MPTIGMSSARHVQVMDVCTSAVKKPKAAPSALGRRKTVAAPLWDDEGDGATRLVLKEGELRPGRPDPSWGGKQLFGSSR